MTTAIIHPDGLQTPVHLCPRLWFTREFFENHDTYYDGKIWRLIWSPEIPDNPTGREKIRAGQPFSTPPRFGIHLCGCLLRLDCEACDHHAIWRLGPYHFASDCILGVWPD
jgi:hypothetical protein